MNDTASHAVPIVNQPVKQQVSRVVLIGNPNTGKSTLFNALSGLHQKTGNYPGVTVEKRTGKYQFGNRSIEVVDLPGTYSLAPRSPDEMLSVHVLLGDPPATRAPDVIVCVINASNLHRNLYLVSQLLELQRPTVIVLNMVDIAAKFGMVIDVDRLSRILGVRVVPTQADRGLGIPELRRSINEAIAGPPPAPHDPFDDAWKHRIQRLEQASAGLQDVSRFLVTRMLFDTDGYMIEQMRDRTDTRFLQALDAERRDLINDSSFAQAESTSRYRWIESQLPHSLTSTRTGSSDPDLLDHWLTHPVLGLVVALVVMAFTFQLVFWAADPASTAIDWLMATITGWTDGLFALLARPPMARCIR